MTNAEPSRLEPLGSVPGLTASRHEVKYLVDTQRLSSLVAALRAHLSLHRHVSGGALPLPDPQHYTTTLYLDTPSRAHFHAARADPANNVKIRAREYYDVHPSLAELATDPKDVVRYEPFMWFELKRRTGTRTSKHRFRLRKVDVASFFNGEQLLPEGLGSAESGSPDDLREVVRYCRGLGEPLSPSSVVNYRRVSFQNPAESLRVTVDVEIAFYEPPPNVWTWQRALVRSLFGAPRGRETKALIEIKQRGEPLPGWLAEALETVSAVACGFGKFERAESAVQPDG